MEGNRTVAKSSMQAAILLAVLLASGTTLLAVEECQYHMIAEVPLTMPFSVMEVGPGDVVYGWVAHALWASSDRGETWEQIRAFPETVGCGGLFVASSGDVFAGITRQGKLWKGVPGTPWSWSTPLVYNCCSCASSWDNSRMWKMDEDSSGRLFVGEYGGAWDDTCAYIHLSEDGGDTWTTAYQCSSRHVHFVSADPYTERVYASIGDGPVRYRLVCSDDGGESWDVLYSQDCLAQPTSVVFTQSARVFGSDCGVTSNMIYTTSDDETFDPRLLLTGDRDSYVWDMSKSGEGYIYAGTKSKLPGGSEVCLYASYDGGENWCGVRGFGVLPEWNGVTDISNFDSAGWAYCTYSTSNVAYSAFRFRHQHASAIAESQAGSSCLAELRVARCPSHSGGMFWLSLPDGDTQCSLRVYNLRGACVRTLVNGPLSAGQHDITWDAISDDGRRAPAGVYFVQLLAHDTTVSTKLVLLP